MTRPPLRAYLSLAASMALVGSYVGLSKLLVAAFPVFLLAWLRFGIAAVAMATWVKRGATEAPLSRHDRRLLFFESFFGNFLFSICMLFGVARSSALTAGVIMAAIPAMVAARFMRSLRSWGQAVVDTAPGGMRMHGTQPRRRGGHGTIGLTRAW